ncbi:MAG: ribulose-phosphate 3-epimerase [Pseudobdellovibrionaceae bacterium]
MITSGTKKVSPSILAADFANLAAEIQRLENAGADFLHVDVMDGHFVPNLTIGPPVVAALKKVSKVPLDVHLMIEDPDRWVADYVAAGSDLITVHIEAAKNPQAIFEFLKKKNVKCGITLKPKTSIETLYPLLGMVDLVLVMTVEPGFGGQSFMEDQVAKIHWLSEQRKKLGLNYWIEVDGGINHMTAKQCFEADIFVAGTYVFKNDPVVAIQNLKSIAQV